MERMNAQLTERQRLLLVRVVEEYVASRQPVGSKTLVQLDALSVSPSTVRAELAELERLGLLTHPHTSAGRVPTEIGYRIYVDGLLSRPEARRPAEFPLGLGDARAEVDEALQVTTEMLSQVTRLLALVSAPPLRAAMVRHVDVLQLQPSLVMVVVITSTGGVSTRRYSFASPVDAGLVTWAGDYLRERVVGVRLRSHVLAKAFAEPGLTPGERLFLQTVRSAFDDVEEERQLYVGGAAGLLDDLRSEEIGAYRSLIDALEKRAALLDVLAQSFGQVQPFARVGDELESSGLHDLALVGATYGYANNTLGAVSLLGPLRMDYEKALRSVRSAAHELSRFVEEVYSEE
jgi:heat-inducible transcriptional repressor